MDMATSAAELLALVEDAIAYKLGKIAVGAYLEMEYRGRKFKDYDITDLFALRDKLKAEVARGDNKFPARFWGLNGSTPI